MYSLLSQNEHVAGPCRCYMPNLYKVDNPLRQSDTVGQFKNTPESK